MPRKPLLSFLPPRSPLQNNNSPSSPASPLPPTPNSERQRLQLRTLASLKSPAFPPLFTATIPKTPYPWIWKCHLCGSVYRLGVTRRCLEDGHFFCSITTPPPSPVHSSDESKSQKSRKTKKRRPKGCRAEFDYTGWEAYNEWRREIRGIKYQCAFSSPSSSSSSNRRPLTTGLEEEEVRNEKKDCYRDCDFPSECLNERIGASEFARLRERERERIRVLEEEWTREREASLPSSSPFFLLAAPASALVQDPIKDPVIDIDGDIKMAESFATEVTRASHDENSEAIEVKGEEEENLGPLGTDSDGLGEESKEVAYSACRRKSLDAGTETPRSPLKECFGVDVGGGVGEMEEVVL
ncbi:hypothetical protein V8E51_006356 [Hyaloscypha variabilis]